MKPETMVVDATTGGQKASKLARYDLIPVDALHALAEHYGGNCIENGGKYEPRNWERGYRWSLSFSALGRHLAQFWGAKMGLPWCGEYDEETGTHHAICAAWHCFTLFCYATRGIGTDDRPLRVEPPAVAT